MSEMLVACCNCVALVTGASSYIGQHLISRLSCAGWQVHGLTRCTEWVTKAGSPNDGVHWHLLDGSTEQMCQILAETKPKVVFHLAAYVRIEHKIADVIPMVSAGVLFGTQLLEAMRQNAVSRIVVAGTYWQNYDNQSYSPYCLYAACKQAFADILKYYVELHGFSAVCLQLADVYGEDDTRPKLLKQLMEAFALDKAVDLTPGEQYIDLIHVEDVCNAFIIAATNVEIETSGSFANFGVASGNPMTIRELVKQLEQICGNTLKAKWGARSYRSRETMLPWSHYERLPNWEPHISLNQELHDLLIAGGVPFRGMRIS